MDVPIGLQDKTRLFVGNRRWRLFKWSQQVVEHGPAVSYWGREAKLPYKSTGLDVAGLDMRQSTGMDWERVQRISLGDEFLTSFGWPSNHIPNCQTFKDGCYTCDGLGFGWIFQDVRRAKHPNQPGEANMSHSYEDHRRSRFAYVVQCTCTCTWTPGQPPELIGTIAWTDWMWRRVDPSPRGDSFFSPTDPPTPHGPPKLLPGKKGPKTSNCEDLGSNPQKSSPEELEFVERPGLHVDDIDVSGLMETTSLVLVERHPQTHVRNSEVPPLSTGPPPERPPHRVQGVFSFCPVPSPEKEDNYVRKVSGHESREGLGSFGVAKGFRHIGLGPIPSRIKTPILTLEVVAHHCFNSRVIPNHRAVLLRVLH